MARALHRPRSPARRKRTDPLVAGFVLAGSVLLLFVVLPLLATLMGTQPDALRETLTDIQVLLALGVTFYSATWATGLAALTGIPLAYLLARYECPGKSWVEGTVNLPVVVPHTAAGIALLMVFGRQAPVGRAFAGMGIHFVDAIPGIVVAMLFVGLPFLVNTAREAFELVDPELEAMAETLGASHWQAFRYVTLPLSLRGISAGAVLMWGRSVSEFGAVVILAYHPKTIPVLVYERFEGFGLAAAQPVAMLLILASLALFIVLHTLLARRAETVTGNG